jgi:hypothetical protein
MTEMLDWLGSTDYAIWVQQSLYGWAIMLTFHAFGNAVIVGVIFIVALRLFGTFRPIPYTTLVKLIPLIWIGLVVQVTSGFSLFLTKPVRYLSDGLFQWKLAFVVLGLLATLYLQKTLNNEAGGWQSTSKVSTRGMQFATASVVFWAGVLVMGRLTAYVGQLYRV